MKQTRNNVPLYLTMPPVERARLDDFAQRVGRPLGWIARDALAAYMDAAEQSPEAMARIKPPVIPLDAFSQTPTESLGRPKKD